MGCRSGFSPTATVEAKREIVVGLTPDTTRLRDKIGHRNFSANDTVNPSDHSARPPAVPRLGSGTRAVVIAGVLAWLAMALMPSPALAVAAETCQEASAQLCIPVEFVLFGLTLLGVALLHHHTLAVALTGLAVITAFKLGFTGFKTGAGFAGLVTHMGHEWVMLTNLLGLLLGFALLARHFEDSGVPKVLPRFLPAGWPGGQE